MKKCEDMLRLVSLYKAKFEPWPKWPDYAKEQEPKPIVF